VKCEGGEAVGGHGSSSVSGGASVTGEGWAVGSGYGLWCVGESCLETRQGSVSEGGRETEAGVESGPIGLCRRS
jgi:hypothetical protein